MKLPRTVSLISPDTSFGQASFHLHRYHYSTVLLGMATCLVFSASLLALFLCDTLRPTRRRQVCICVYRSISCYDFPLAPRYFFRSTAPTVPPCLDTLPEHVLDLASGSLACICTIALDLYVTTDQ